MFKQFHQVKLQVLERNHPFPLLTDLGFLNSMALPGHQIKPSAQGAACKLRSSGENVKSQNTEKVGTFWILLSYFQSHHECVKSMDFEFTKN